VLIYVYVSKIGKSAVSPDDGNFLIV
jgi:hypothetical protein